ncbi:hypothetical protein [Caulobacter sp. FWC2]|uniref:hypothetical protein n=1 Tax=Caulobacter sp. FWC2 TaxID=69664 RepID=UPI000C150842|nr:hypothetical protein [Caulobacter sp. FWC2]PIB90511.1 hypothetical protein CSW62_02360 [Caulobacter sp. FWC2]
MTEVPGKAGGALLRNATNAKRERPYQYSVDLGPALSMRLSSELPDNLEIGLLVCPPLPNDRGYEELETSGYERQKLEFARSGPRYVLANKTVVQFGPLGHSWRKPSHAAIFSGEGRLLYYGALYQRTPPAIDAAPNWIEFDANTIRTQVL